VDLPVAAADGLELTLLKSSAFCFSLVTAFVGRTTVGPATCDPAVGDVNRGTNGRIPDDVSGRTGISFVGRTTIDPATFDPTGGGINRGTNSRILNADTGGICTGFVGRTSFCPMICDQAAGEINRGFNGRTLDDAIGGICTGCTRVGPTIFDQVASDPDLLTATTDSWEPALVESSTFGLSVLVESFFIA